VPLDARITAAKLRELYVERKETISILLTGETGAGKTYLMRTAPSPVHIDSFDPDGSLSIRDEVRKGNVIVANYEQEDPFYPSAFKEWEKNFRELRLGGYFDSIGTYVIDTATNWTQSMLNFTLGKRGKAGSLPEWAMDYHPQKVALDNYIHLMTGLPCHFILIAHLMPKTDKEGNVIQMRVNFPGQGAVNIPSKFSEIWRMERVEKSNDFDYFIHTQESGLYVARSRLSNLGQLEKREKAHLRNIFKKAGVNYADKPKLLENEPQSGSKEKSK
jgi:AAA domain